MTYQRGQNLVPVCSSFIMLPFLIILGAFLKCAIAKIGFEKNKVSQGFEALARAQCLLRSKVSLGKMPLLSQVMVFLFSAFGTSFLFEDLNLFSWLRYEGLILSVCLY